MSKIANRIIKFPEDVSLSLNGDNLSVSGPNSSLSIKIPNDVVVSIEKNELKTSLSSLSDRIEIVGTFNSLIKNMIEGSKSDFKKSILLKGVGYKAEINNGKIIFNIGYSHPVSMNIPENLKVSYSSGVIRISGAEKQQVGLFASRIRKLKEPNPFVKNLKGFFYQFEDGTVENIKLKSFKKQS